MPLLYVGYCNGICKTCRKLPSCGSIRISRRRWRSLPAAGQSLTLGDAVRPMAKLGGLLGRKGDGEPGVKTLWRGYRPLQWLCGWDRARQNPSQDPPCRNPSQLGTGFSSALNHRTHRHSNRLDEALRRCPIARHSPLSDYLTPKMAGYFCPWVKIRENPRGDRKNRVPARRAVFCFTQGPWISRNLGRSHGSPVSRSDDKVDWRQHVL
jgi:hypothetical protein